VPEFDPQDMEAILELLDDKMVRTTKGSFIAVEDLRNLVKDYAELRKEREQKQPRHKTMTEARRAAKLDKELIAMFEKKSSPPPLDVARKDVVKEREAAQAASQALKE
jgi:predicted HAD superfamily Cof-like phosphohydrolase